MSEFVLRNGGNIRERMEGGKKKRKLLKRAEKGEKNPSLLPPSVRLSFFPTTHCCYAFGFLCRLLLLPCFFTERKEGKRVGFGGEDGGGVERLWCWGVP